MISSHLRGGLGNLLFQISAAYALALRNNNEAKFNLSSNNYDRPKAETYKNNLFKNIQIINNIDYLYTYIETKFNYVEIPFKNDMILSGCFQSEKYFIDFKKEIYELLYPIDVANNLKEKYGDILKDSVSLHVRRGDYLKLQNYHPCPNINYYNNAINTIKKEKNINKILIFSDDINWCKSQFICEEYVFIEGQKDYEDIILMSLCDNNIIANSSFSWWGSWLNQNNDKKVIAPKLWFGELVNNDWNDIYFEKIIIL